jgi:hypothetical protein
VVEVDRDGRRTFTYARRGAQFMRAARLPNGDLACVVLERRREGRFLRLDPSGKELRSFPVQVHTFGGRVDVQPDGRVLVPERDNNRVVEYDADGREVAAFAVEQPVAAVRLANGNTLATSLTQMRAVELDPAGKEVWQFRAPTRVNRAWRR